MKEEVTGGQQEQAAQEQEQLHQCQPLIDYAG